MQKVQTVNLSFIEDRERIIEEFKWLGFITEVVGDDLNLYWGKRPQKPKKEQKKDAPEHKPGQEKTARRLGR
jgi:DNA topoisomerase IA